MTTHSPAHSQPEELNRAEFEDAYDAQYPGVAHAQPGKFDRDDTGEYKDTIVFVAWDMWQIARRAAAPSVPAGEAPIKTWKQRMDEFGYFVDGDVLRVGWMAHVAARDAEIADLRAALAQQPVQPKPDDEDNLSVMLWLLRRLPRCYDNPTHVVQAIERLAKRTGTDVSDSFSERAAATNKTEKKNG